MVRRNQLERNIRKIDDKDLTVEEKAELETTQRQLQEVVAEQKLYNTSGNIRKIIQDSGPKDSEGNPMIEFRDVSSAKETQEMFGIKPKPFFPIIAPSVLRKILYHIYPSYFVFSAPLPRYPLSC